MHKKYSDEIETSPFIEFSWKWEHSLFFSWLKRNATMWNFTYETHFNNVFPCNYYSYIIFFTKQKTTYLISTGSHNQNLTKLLPRLSLKCMSAWYWVIRPFVAHSPNANLGLMSFSHRYYYQKWTKKKMGPHGKH